MAAAATAAVRAEAATEAARGAAATAAALAAAATEAAAWVAARAVVVRAVGTVVAVMEAAAKAAAMVVVVMVVAVTAVATADNDVRPPARQGAGRACGQWASAPTPQKARGYLAPTGTWRAAEGGAERVEMGCVAMEERAGARGRRHTVLEGV